MGPYLLLLVGAFCAVRETLAVVDSSRSNLMQRKQIRGSGTLQETSVFSLETGEVTKRQRKAGVHSKREVYSAVTDFYGPWIVELELDYHDHDGFILAAEEVHKSYRTSPEKHSLALKRGFKAMHKFKKAINGVVIDGVSAEHLQDLRGAKHVTFNGKAYATGGVYALQYLWGLDRIDQTSLPLDGLNKDYNPDYSGSGVDVYVLDTGVDTNHLDFNNDNNTFTREVENVWNAYGAVTTDTDGNGHGTHCAGTIGGWFSGVAKGANIYGMKVLDDDGSGSLSDIIDAIEYVLDNPSGRPSVMSLSLAADCGGSCEGHPLNAAIENAYTEGVVSAVAAGNERCNSQYLSPGSAPSAVTVGATDIYDDPSYFSNFGEFVDIWAPGSDIYSACNFAECGDETTLIELSGTSMATPHVAGVLAQLLEKNPSATPQETIQALQCDAAKEELLLDQRDTITPNLFLQTPQNDGLFGTCNLGEGCSGNCSNNGYCAPAHSSSAYGSTDNICYCHSQFGGAQCEMSASLAKDTRCANGALVTVDLDPGSIDTYGWGWDYSYGFTIYTNGTDEKIIVDYARDSMCQFGAEGAAYHTQRTYCLAEGCYTMDAATVPVWLWGYAALNADNEWSVCDIAGEGDSQMDFCVSPNVNGHMKCSRGEGVDEDDFYNDDFNNDDDDNHDDDSGASLNWKFFSPVAVGFFVAFTIGGWTL